ncbi:MAG: hypothetical protein PHT32_06960, partial [Candidatus Omnitrophica bacterium]|nr:hypothetical protein [Candidatus Omnitrophota bacterium]
MKAVVDVTNALISIPGLEGADQVSEGRRSAIARSAVMIPSDWAGIINFSEDGSYRDINQIKMTLIIDLANRIEAALINAGIEELSSSDASGIALYLALNSDTALQDWKDAGWLIETEGVFTLTQDKGVSGVTRLSLIQKALVDANVPGIDKNTVGGIATALAMNPDTDLKAWLDAGWLNYDTATGAYTAGPNLITGYAIKLKVEKALLDAGRDQDIPALLEKGAAEGIATTLGMSPDSALQNWLNAEWLVLMADEYAAGPKLKTGYAWKMQIETALENAAVHYDKKDKKKEKPIIDFPDLLEKGKADGVATYLAQSGRNSKTGKAIGALGDWVKFKWLKEKRTAIKEGRKVVGYKYEYSIGAKFVSGYKIKLQIQAAITKAATDNDFSDLLKDGVTEGMATYLAMDGNALRTWKSAKWLKYEAYKEGKKTLHRYVIGVNFASGYATKLQVQDALIKARSEATNPVNDKLTDGAADGLAAYLAQKPKLLDYWVKSKWLEKHDDGSYAVTEKGRIGINKQLDKYNKIYGPGWSGIMPILGGGSLPFWAGITVLFYAVATLITASVIVSRRLAKDDDYREAPALTRANIFFLNLIPQWFAVMAYPFVKGAQTLAALSKAAPQRPTVGIPDYASPEVARAVKDALGDNITIVRVRNEDTHKFVSTQG